MKKIFPRPFPTKTMDEYRKGRLNFLLYFIKCELSVEALDRFVGERLNFLGQIPDAIEELFELIGKILAVIIFLPILIPIYLIMVICKTSIMMPVAFRKARQQNWEGK